MTKTAERGNLEWIVGKVAEIMKVDAAALRTATPEGANRELWRVAAYAAYTIGDRNLVEVGAALGGVDHSRVLYARTVVEKRMKLDPMFRLGVTKLLDELSIALF